MDHVKDSSDSICAFFKMDKSRFQLINVKSTEWVRRFFNETTRSFRSKEFSYVEELDTTCDSYAMFGADKCEIHDFYGFCEKNNVNAVDHFETFLEQTQNGNPPKQFHFVSRDNKLTFTCKTLAFKKYGTVTSCDVQYFGVTGQTEQAINTFDLFQLHARYSELSWGNRSFI